MTKKRKNRLYIPGEYLGGGEFAPGEWLNVTIEFSDILDKARDSYLAKQLSDPEDCDGEYDLVNPDHYKHSKDSLGVEVADILDYFFPDNPWLWNAGKYLLRAGHKPSADKKTELGKLKWYVDRELRGL